MLRALSLKLANIELEYGKQDGSIAMVVMVEYSFFGGQDG
jgi:hypothetical protein